MTATNPSSSSPFVLRLAFHQSNWRGHGGVHRTTQVVELLQRTGLEVPPAPQPGASVKAPGSAQVLKKMLGTYLPAVKSALGAQAEVWRFRKGLWENRHAKVMVWEDTKRHFPLHEARRRGLKVVAIPQNMESFDRPDLPEGRQKVGALKGEIEALLEAHVIFALSREDTWFLRLFGATAFCLPYYPPSGLEAELLSIREARTGRPATRFLLVGSAVHESTRLGLLEGLTWLREARKKVPFQLDVAGYGTEKLRGCADHPDFSIHGGVSQEQLVEMQRSAAGAIIHHSPYSGSLTRVCETLMAGIPVIANEDGARAAPYPGVHVYRDVDELSQLLSTELAVPPLPPRPSREEGRFVETLNGFVTG